MVKLRFKEHLHGLAKNVGVIKYDHEGHPLTLRRLILLCCVFSFILVGISSWMFYSDPRSKYDLVRPGRRVLPESFRAEEVKSEDKTRDDLKLELQNLQKQLNGLDIYGGFNDQSLSDGKVLQSYLDQPVLEQ